MNRNNEIRRRLKLIGRWEPIIVAALLSTCVLSAQMTTDTLARFDGIITTRMYETNDGALLSVANAGVFRVEPAAGTIVDVMPEADAAMLTNNPWFVMDRSSNVYALTEKMVEKSNWQAYRSSDNGKTWSRFATSDSLGMRGNPPWRMHFQYKFSCSRDNWIRFYGSFYDPNTKSWYSQPGDSCMPTYTQTEEMEGNRVVHVGNGVYQARDSELNKWHQVDVVSGECTGSPFPPEASYLSVPPGHTDYAMNYSVTKPLKLWRRASQSDTLALINPVVTDRDTIAELGEYHTPLTVGDYTVLISKTAGRVLILDRDKIRELNLAAWRECIEVQPEGVYLDSYSSADSTIVLILHSNTCGRKRARFSLETGEMTDEYFCPQYNSNPGDNHLLSNTTTTNQNTFLIRTDLFTGIRTRIGRYAGTNSSLHRPIAFCESSYLGDTLCSVDQFGFINQVQSADSCVLPEFAYDNSVDFTLRARSDIPFTLGLPRVAPLKGALASLGPSFKVLYNRTTFTEKRKDTVTVALQRADGSWLLGYRSLFATSDSGATRTLVSSPADSVSAISGIVETGNGGMLVSRRGYNLRGRGPEPVDVVGGLWLQPKPDAPWQQAGTELAETEGIGPMVLSLARNPLDGSIWASNCWVSAVAQFSGTPNGDSSFYYSGSLYDYRLHRSTDGGMSWHLMARVDDNWNYAPTTGSVSFSSTGTVAWTLHDRIMISSDGGMQWQSTQDQGTLGLPICSAMFDKQDNLVIASRNGLFSIPFNAVSVEEDNRYRTADGTASSVWATTQPNPTPGTFTVSLYNLDHLRGELQRLHVVDVSGRIVVDLTSLVSGNHSSGRVDVPVNLEGCASSVYMLVGTDGYQSFTRPIVVVTN